MKKIYYYIDPNDGKLLSIISDLSWTRIKESIGLDDKIPCIEKSFDLENFKTEDFLRLQMIEYLKLDFETNEILIDSEKLRVGYLDLIKKLRADIFYKLDLYAVRAVSLGKTDVAKEVEHDKQLLRDIPTSFNFLVISTLKDFISILPIELLIDYDDKYKSKL